MKLTKEDVRDVAKLARLSLTDVEEAMYAEQLSVVFEYMDMLNEVDTTEVAETTQVTGLVTVFREDVSEPISVEERQALIDAFPEKTGTALKVKSVFES